MRNNDKIIELKKMLKEREFYSRIGSKLYFDIECLCPRNGYNQASEDMTRIEMEKFKISHSKKFIRLVLELHDDNEGLSDYDKILIKHLYKEYANEKNVSSKLMESFSKASNDAYIHWLEAKENKEYNLFKPYLKRVIDLTKKMYLKRDEQKETLYDTILADYEENWSIKRYDEFFNRLKEALIPLIKKIVASKKKIRNDFLTRNVPIYKQEEFSKFLLLKEGHDFDNLVLLTTEHPFTINMNEGDERVTTHYFENNFLSNVFSIMHEGGHALFDLGEPKEFKDHFISQKMTCAMHECMSRLYENMIARSEAFINLIYPKFQELFKDEFNDVSEKELFEACNISTPSLNRCDSDELTYVLHIIIRYELEKEFINNKTNVNGLNKKWNKLYKEYLGIEVPNDKEGILQDVHWTGSYGYFPTYALGSAYAAQIYHCMKKEIDIDNAIRNDNIKLINDWLKEHAWNIASIKNPDEWIKEVTKEEFNPQYFIDYLVEKYTKLYDLK